MQCENESVTEREFDCAIVVMNAGDLHGKIVSVYINKMNQVAFLCQELFDFPQKLEFKYQLDFLVNMGDG